MTAVGERKAAILLKSAGLAMTFRVHKAGGLRKGQKGGDAGSGPRAREAKPVSINRVSVH